ncbi:oligoendopeptidase F, partial [Candidatus Parcubacteria bacterium]
MAVLRKQNVVWLSLLGVLCAMGVTEKAHAEAGYRSRDEIPAKYKWDLSDIFKSWDEWEQGLKEFEQKIDELAALKGTLSQGPEQLLKVYQLRDELGKLAYLIYRYPALQFDLNQKNTDIRAKTQQVFVLFEKQTKAEAWFAPELLSIPLETVRKWMDENEQLATYRFAIEKLYRLQAHVLDEEGELLLAYNERFNQTPADIFSALSTADIVFPTITLSNGEEVMMTPGTYQTILLTNRNQADRAAAFEAYYQPYKTHINT